MDTQSFEFVSDVALRNVLRDYYGQARKASEVESYIGVIVGCGSVVEGLLTWALLKREAEAQQSKRAQKNKDGQPVPIRQWNLTALIQVCVELELIGKTAEQASWALKDFRNFIHPYNVLQQSARPDQALALSSEAALAEILRSLAGRGE